MQVAAKGERMTERIPIAAWIVCGHAIVEYSTNSTVKKPSVNKVDPVTALLSENSFCH